MNRWVVIVFFYLIIGASAFGQENRYAVFFTDKEGTEFTTSTPEKFLSDRALQKRKKFDIPILAEDLPVSKTYLDNLSQYEMDLLFTTKWLNGAIVETNAEVITQIESEPFVMATTLIAPGTITSSRMPTPEKVEHQSTKATTNADVMDSHATQLQNQMLGVDDMHKDGYRGEGMLVAVFDSGFKHVDTSSYFTHLSKNDQIYGARDFIKKTEDVYQYDGHGTKVLSTMAAYKAMEFEGVAYKADYVLCITEDVRSEHNIEEYNWLLAAEYADSLGVDVINSSVAYSYFDEPSESYTYSDMDGQTTVVSKAASVAVKKGIIVVASVGNEGNKIWTYLNAPSDADTVLGIGAVDDTIEKSSFSSFGPSADDRIKPDLVALGSGVSVVNGNSLSFSNGTSFSTPLVAGLATGFWQAFPDLSPWEISSYLKSTASNANTPDTLIGYGLPNYTSANRMVLSAEEDVRKEFVVFPNPNEQKRVFVYPAGMLEVGKVEINFRDLKGRQIKRVSDYIYSDQDTMEVDITSLSPGYYFLMFNTESKTIKSKLIVR